MGIEKIIQEKKKKQELKVLENYLKIYPNKKLDT